MKNDLLLYSLVLVSIAIIQSCKKKKVGCTDPISINYDVDADKDDGSCTYAGTGGNTTVLAYPTRNGIAIVSKIGWVDSAFIKFNAIESPGLNPTDYDLLVAGQVGEDHIRIEGLKTGKYYFYVTGFDSTIVQRVSGGTALFITQNYGIVYGPIQVSE